MYNLIKNLIQTKTLLTTVCLFILAGCATSSTGSAPRQSTLDQRIQTTNVPADSGVVIVKVLTGQRSGLTTLSQNWTQLRVVNLSGKDNTLYEANNLQTGQVDHMLFMLVLPAGTYQIEELHAISDSVNDPLARPIALAESCKCDKEFSVALQGTGYRRAALLLKGSRPFSVRQGTITDLGTLAVIPDNKNAEIKTGVYARDVVVHPLANAQAETTQLLSIFRSKLPANLKIRTDNPWISSSLDVESQPLRGLSWNFLLKQAPENSSGIYAEQFGQIRVRENRKWVWLDTGLSMHIKSVMKLEDGTLLAGASHGVVLAQTQGSTEWKNISLPLPDSEVQSLGYHKHLGLIATALSGGELVVFSSPGVGAPWIELHRIPAQGSTFTNIQISTGSHGLLASVIEFGFTYDAQLYHLDGNTKAWFSSQIPKNFAGIPGVIAVNADGSIYQTQGGMKYSANGSIDAGRSWYKLSLPEEFRQLRMMNQRTGYVFAQSRTNSYSLWKTADGGKSWDLLGATPALFMWLQQIAEDELAAIGQDFKIYISRDGGKTWKEDAF